MKKTAFVFCLLYLALMGFAQESTPEDDIAQLFNENNEQNNTQPPKTENDILSNIFSKGINIKTAFSLKLGYSPGLNYLPWEISDPAQLAYVDAALLSLSASLSSLVRVSPEFSFSAKISLAAPLFAISVSELFCDYTFLNTIFTRIGKQAISWGISSNFGFADPIARRPQTPLPSAYNLALKISLPLGVGGIESVFFIPNSFWEESAGPDFSDLALGLRFNLAIQNLDLAVGSYYHPFLLWRSFYTLKTTIFDTIEAYSEGCTATDLFIIADPVLASWYFSVNGGFFVELFDRLLKLNLEYFYCGEKDDLTVQNQTFPLFPGHNLALNLRFNLSQGFKLLFQGKYNFNDTSGLLIPALSWEALPHLNLTLALSLTLGDLASGYSLANSDNKQRRIALLFLLELKGDYKFATP